MKITNTLCANFLRKFILFLMVIILPVSLSAFDFGLVTNVYTGYGDTVGSEKADEDDFPIELKFDILPRFSLLIGDNADFFMSAGISFDKESDFFPIPELLRTEFTMRFGNMGLKAGRLNYSDPLAFIASGLFDGLMFNLNSPSGRFSVGAFYTGLLYKKNANITMNLNDLESYDLPVDFSEFASTYFAPKRFITALEWDHPSVREAVHLNIAAICQFDLAESDRYNNQYFIFKVGVPIKSYIFGLGGAVELSQSDDESNMAFAGDIGFLWMLPTNIVSTLSFSGKFAGGKVEDSFEAFTPITTKYLGNILKHKMSGLSILSLDYMARLGEKLGTNVTASYFVRNDLGTFQGYPLSPESEGYLLGPEVFARLIWSPLSDIQFNLGGGAFFPSLGNAGKDEKLQWRVELTAILALF